WAGGRATAFGSRARVAHRPDRRRGARGPEHGGAVGAVEGGLVPHARQDPRAGGLARLDRLRDRALDLPESASHLRALHASTSTTGSNPVSSPSSPSSRARTPTPSARLSATWPKGRSSTIGPRTAATRISRTASPADAPG